jgi:DNA polymerase I-like protein with 3'-5' exonuclease and polymerase domains
VLELLTKAQRCATRIGLFYTVWPLWVHPKDGNVHPGIRCVGTETHRPSGSNPNLLQLPKRNEGKKVRKCILPNKKFG